MNNILDKFKNNIYSKKYVYGVFLKTADPMFSEICGLSGFDFAILDLEHGPTNFETLQNNIRACELRNIVPIVRVPSIDENMIGKVLDIGAFGVQVPQVKTVEDVKNVIKYSKFFPLGERGVCRFVRAAEYSNIEKSSYFSNANENLIILQLEGQEAINNLDEILDIDGYDIIFIGPYDLSQSLGVPGEINNPLVLSEMINIVEKAKQKGKVVGTFTEDYEMVSKWKELGVQYISFSTDAGIMMDAFKNIRVNLSLDLIEKKRYQLFDCTLSDGGTFFNNEFTPTQIRSMLRKFLEAKVDIIEVGHLMPLSKSNGSIYNNINDTEKYFSKKMIGNFSVKYTFDIALPISLHKYNGYGVNLIRLCFNKNDLSNISNDIQSIKNNGYKIALCPNDLYSYSFSEINYLISLSLEYNIDYVFLYDYFGDFNFSVYQKHFNYLKNKLDKKTKIVLYIKNNLQLGMSVLTKFIEKNDYSFVVCVSVRGVNRKAINLSTEAVMNYFNSEFNLDYKITSVLEIENNYIKKLIKRYNFDNDFECFLATKYECEYDYVEYLYSKNNLTISNIESILGMIDLVKKDVFDKVYIESLYISYLERNENLNDDFEKIKNIMKDKSIIVVCPGKSINFNKEKIISFSNEESIVISVNFDYDCSDYVFVGNNKRMNEMMINSSKALIVTSNVPCNNVFGKINYSKLLNGNEYVRDNSGLMLLKLLFLCQVKEVIVFGMDGYSYNNNENYVNDDLTLVSKKETIDNLNLGMRITLKWFSENMNITFIR